MSNKTGLKYFLFALCFIFFLAFTKDVLASWILNSEGWLVSESDQQVLGRKEEKTTPPGLGKMTEPAQQVGEAKRVRLEPKDYQLQITIEDETGEEIGAPEGTETESDEFEIEEPEDKTTVKVRSLKNSYAIIRDKIAAQTHFPLMVNLETNELIVTTPAGQKTVTVLPDQAVKNMLAANVIDQLGGKGGLLWLEYQASVATPSPTPIATEAATPTPEVTSVATATPGPGVPLIESIISLITTDEGILTYEIEGIKHERFLSFIKVMLKRKVIVSAETGELLGIEEDLPTRILDFFSV